jgi:hypothetical protein
METKTLREYKDVYGYKFAYKIRVGGFWIELPEPPPLEEILNYELAIPDQKYQYSDIWTQPYYMTKTHDERLEYIDSMWKLRREGQWFLNNGNLEYITGLHWFFLNCYLNDEGEKMEWFDRDRDFWLLWDWVEKNPQCTGLVFSTGRRFGKTAKALCMLLEYATGTTHAHVGIQSKVEQDSKDYFERLVYAWQNMPFFFQPIHTGVKTPKTELVFKEPSVRAVKNSNFEYYKVLNSKIDYENSKEKAYDGKKLKRCLHDEAAKFEDGNAKKRYDVVRECLMRGKDIIGKIMLTSTIESTESGDSKSKNGLAQAAVNFQELWEKSDYSKLSENGRTETGLIRYFQSAAYGLQGYIDEYGYADIEAADAYIERELAALTGDDALAYRKRYPRSETDMFGTNASENGLDINKILQQTDWNNKNVNNSDNSNVKVMRGDFVWESLVGGRVRWLPNPSGRFNVCWLPKYENANRVTRRNQQLMPANFLEGVIGCDPISSTDTTDNTKSNFAAVGYRIGGLEDSKFNKCFVFVYNCRTTYPESHYEDMWKAAIYYGYQICLEDNRQAFKNWIRERAINYLTPRPMETAPDTKNLSALDFGIPTTGSRVRDLLVNYLKVYVYENCGVNDDEQIGNVYFNDILDDWRKFRPETRWTKYDLSVATMMALAGAMGTSVYKREIKKPVMLNLPKFDNTGTRSKRL